MIKSGLARKLSPGADEDLKFRSGDRIANAHAAALDDPRRDAALPAHRVVTTYTQNLIHAGAWMRFPGGFQQGSADAEPLFLKGDQIYAFNHDIATDEFRRDRHVVPKETGDRAQVFRPDQRHLSATAHVLIVISNDPAFGLQFGRLDVNHPCPPFRTQADPDHTSRPDGRGHQFGEWRLRV